MQHAVEQETAHGIGIGNGTGLVAESFLPLPNCCPFWLGDSHVQLVATTCVRRSLMSSSSSSSKYKCCSNKSGSSNMCWSLLIWLDFNSSHSLCVLRQTWFLHTHALKKKRRYFTEIKKVSLNILVKYIPIKWNNYKYLISIF